MALDFPLSVDMLLNVLEVIAPFKHFSKLREFVEMKLPPGFPVSFKIHIILVRLLLEYFKYILNLYFFLWSNVV